MVKALNVVEGTDEQLLGSGGACRTEAFGTAGSKGNCNGHMHIDVDMTEIKWIEEGWAHGYKVFIGDLTGHIGKLDLAECTKGQVDLAINANATRSGMAFAIATFGDVAQAIDCCKAATQLTFEHGTGTWHWACPTWFRSSKKAKAHQ